MKLYITVGVYLSSRSRPTWGAWIETSNKSIQLLAIRLVAPHVGRVD